MPELHLIHTTVNGQAYERETEARVLLSDFLRHDLGLFGLHVGCEQGACGACTILFDGLPVRACLMLAVQADGHALLTVESLGTPDKLNVLQSAFWEKHGLQCGYCTPGILMTLTAFLQDNPTPTDHAVRTALSGNLCRCTGYQNIVAAALLAAEQLLAAAPAPQA